MNLQQLLSQETLKKLEQITLLKPQSLLITANSQSQLDLALNELLAKTGKNDEVYEIQVNESGKIKIDAIRQIISHAVITPRQDRYFIIHQADKMLAGAQNALLKFLEEPLPHHFLWLFSTQPDQLLITIRSRTQKIILPNLEPQKVKDFFSKQYTNLTPNELGQIAFIADENLDLWQDILNNNDKFTKNLDLAATAKKIISSKDLYTRLQLIQSVTTKRDDAIILISYILKIYQKLLMSRPSPSICHKIKLWLTALQRIQNNGSLRLNLISAALG